MEVKGGFRVVIRVKDVGKDLSFIEQVRSGFPLMYARNGLVFEIGQFPEK